MRQSPKKSVQATRGGALPSSLLFSLHFVSTRRYDAPGGSSRSRGVFCVAVPAIAELVRHFVMTVRFWTCFSLILAACFCFSCASRSPKQRAMICEIHHCPMKVEDIRLVVGQLPIPFVEAIHTNFPHPGGWRVTPDWGYLDMVSVKAPVCPQCTKSLIEWQTKWGEMLKEQPHQ
jgi:hypothetical protein